jgi:hypothetical protein
MSRRFNRRPTEAERSARRQADRDRIEQAARALLTSDGWRRWIKVRATNGLSRYSLRNQWLNRDRLPRPRYHADLRPRLPRLPGAQPLRPQGERALKILAPVTVKQLDAEGEEAGETRIFFRSVSVFDVSQTEPLPGKEPVPLGPPAQPIAGDSHARLLARSSS